VDLDLLAAREEEHGAAVLLAEDLEERRRPDPKEPVDSARRCDSHLAGPADSRVAVDLDEHLSVENAKDLIRGIVAVKVSYVVGRNGLHPHDEAPQPVVGSSDGAELVGSR
jgi:hypothetical protein